MVIYNEIEPFCVEWLRNLSTAGHIASGVVDHRSIRDLAPDDVRDAAQAHFFAGIGVWSAALRLARWPDDVPVWTGSCPCQPFSAAGRGGGFDDERHLWPAWFNLIRECSPPVIFGEQVASPAGLEWFDLVSSDLEGAGYAVGAADLCAAGIGAPHIRQRLYFVAYARRTRLEIVRKQLARRERPAIERSRAARPLGDTDFARCGRGKSPGTDCNDARECAEACDGRPTGFLKPQRTGEAGGLADLSCYGRLEGRRPIDKRSGSGYDGTDGIDRFWASVDWIPCSDGKARPVESGTFPLAHGASARVGRLRAYGNAIVLPLAAAFIETAIDVIVGAQDLPA